MKTQRLFLCRLQLVGINCNWHFSPFSCNDLVLMRVFQQETETNSDRPTCIPFLTFTWDRTEKELRLVWLRLGEANYRTSLRPVWFRGLLVRQKTNLRPSGEISSQYVFLVMDIYVRRTHKLQRWRTTQQETTRRRQKDIKGAFVFLSVEMLEDLLEVFIRLTTRLNWDVKSSIT